MEWDIIDIVLILVFIFLFGGIFLRIGGTILYGLIIVVGIVFLLRLLGILL